MDIPRAGSYLAWMTPEQQGLSLWDTFDRKNLFIASRGVVHQAVVGGQLDPHEMFATSSFDQPECSEDVLVLRALSSNEMLMYMANLVRGNLFCGQSFVSLLGNSVRLYMWLLLLGGLGVSFLVYRARAALTCLNKANCLLVHWSNALANPLGPIFSMENTSQGFKKKH
eukprot:15326217-Ditylum_brightwellii.AAC.1